MAASIEREIGIDAPPEVVYQVISSAEHLRNWWPDHAEIDAVPGATGFVAFGEPGSPEAKVVAMTVVEADPPRRFAFRWCHDRHEAATPANSLLVTFDLIPTATGTLLRFRETGFAGAGLGEAEYRDHVSGWDHFLPRLSRYATQPV
jgi:uncharacterized protein YndB with AHSA1/START domain